VTDRDRLYLEHIVAAIELIRDYTREGKQGFLADRKTQDAVIRQLEIIGEATRQIGDELKSAHPGIPWRAMIGNRDRMIHGYFQVDLARVWATVAEDLSVLDEQIRGILAAKPTS
jgi:uncharacterized protein with HEPN domain